MCSINIEPTIGEIRASFGKLIRLLEEFQRHRVQEVADLLGRLARERPRIGALEDDAQLGKEAYVALLGPSGELVSTAITVIGGGKKHD